MENSEIELRKVLVKITDYISGNELRKLKFIFSNEIRRDGNDDTTINGAINFFQQLLDRGIIDSQNLSKLINALDDIACHQAAQLLKNYQLQIAQVPKNKPLFEQLFEDTELDKQSTHVIIHQGINEYQQESLLDNNKNTTSRLTINEKTNTKIIRKKDLIYLIIILIYTIILILLLCYTITKIIQQKTKPLPVGNKNIYKRAQYCQPHPCERYFIKSHYSGKLIGVVNNTIDQGGKLYQCNDTKNQSYDRQWYFVPIINRGKEKIYVIQSVYNHKVFDVSNKNSSNDNSIRQCDIDMNNVNQQFRLIYVQNENSCQIQSLATKKVLNGITKEFITQTDLEINKKDETLWQLIPFDIDRPGDKLTNCPYVSSINDLTVIKFGNVFGDNVGHSTDDSKEFRLTVFHYISSISFVWSDWLNSMECIYSSSNPLNKESPKSGVVRGSVGIYSKEYRNDTFNVTEKNPNERINRVYVFINAGKDDSKVSTPYIIGIQFYTTYNRTSPVYGSQQGRLYVEEYQGFGLGYVRSGAHMHIERLQFIWYKI